MTAGDFRKGVTFEYENSVWLVAVAMALLDVFGAVVIFNWIKSKRTWMVRMEYVHKAS